LDEIAPDNPVFLTRADGHAAIANSAALRIAKIDKNTSNPFGGEILKDKATGEPTGMLLDNAQDLVAKNIPKPTEAEHEQAFLLGIQREIGLGWCEIQNAGSYADDIKIIRKCLDEGKVKLRFINERGEPMIEFYAAVARKSVKGFSAEGWHSEQAVSREQALKMFTLWPAYAAFEENDKGSIEPGKLADFTVLSNDIMKIPEPDILKTRCVMTIIGGETEFEDRGFH
jgi:predicted amidohydrolase YtcJ